MSAPRVPSTPAQRTTMITASRLRKVFRPMVHPLLGFLLVSLTLFIPSWSGVRINSPFPDSLANNLNALILAFSCSLSLTAPLLIDTILDYLSMKNIPYLNHRILSTTTFAISNTLILIYMNSHLRDTIMISSLLWSYFIEFTIVLNILYSMHKSPTLAHSIFSQIITPFALYIFIMGSILNSNNGFQGVVSGVLSTSGLVVFTFIVIIRSIIVLYKHYYLFSKSGKTIYEWLISIDDQIFYSEVLIFGLNAQLFIFYILFFAIRSPSITYPFFHFSHILYIIIMRTLFFTFTYFVSARVFRNKLVKNNQDLAFKTQLIKYFSHEIRSPIMVMSLGLELIEQTISNHREQNDQVMAEMVEDNVAMVRNSCEQSLEILDSMLLYEKIETGSLHPEFSSHDPIDGVREILGSFESAATTLNVGISLQFIRSEFDANTRKIKIDKAKLRVVFAALLTSYFKKTNIRIPQDSRDDSFDTAEEAGVFLTSGLPRAREQVVKRTKRRSMFNERRVTGEEAIFLARFSEDFELPQSVQAQGLRSREGRGSIRSAPRAPYGLSSSVCWMHIEMIDRHGDIRESDIAQMYSHTLDFTRKG